MIEANQYIFKVLAEFVEDKNIERSMFTEAKRCIETDDREKEWLQKLTIQDTQIILPTFTTAYFVFEEHKYFVTIGSMSQLLTEPEIIQKEELNGGIITALIFQLKIPVKQSAEAIEIVQEIFYEPQEKITKYEFSQVSKFFETIFVYKIQDESTFIDIDVNNKSTVNIVKLSGFYILKHQQIISLKFDKETIRIFERLFIEGAKNIPFDNLVFSLVSVYWRYSFLDVYRCIERLFSISFFEDFHQYLGIENSLSLLNFSAKIEDYTGWRPNEDAAINKLIAGSPQDAIELLQEVKNFSEGKNTQINKLPIKFLFWTLLDIDRLIDILLLSDYRNTESKLGQLIYKIRNSIVHFRPATEQISMDDQHWNKLIRASLLIIEYWYHKYDEQLNR